MSRAFATPFLGLAAGTLVALGALGDAAADAPDIRTDGPIIHLQDNLDEKDRLGWCIDTVGRGRSDSLQVHSCKPAPARDRDVTFTYDPDSGQIRSAAYAGLCATLNEPGGERRFGLVECDAGDAAQAFDYDEADRRLSPRGQDGQCLAAGGDSASAGPFMSRTLVLAPCDETAPELRSWVIRP